MCSVLDDLKRGLVLTNHDLYYSKKRVSNKTLFWNNNSFEISRLIMFTYSIKPGKNLLLFYFKSAKQVITV